MQKKTCIHTNIRYVHNYARYYHLNETKVKVGDYVSRGEKIGVSGHTGLTTVNSIGLAIYSNDTKVDPDSFLTQDLKSKKNKN